MLAPDCLVYSSTLKRKAVKFYQSTPHPRGECCLCLHLLFIQLWCLCCQFHDRTDAVPYCSLSCVRRWAFVILDHCCKDLDIELIPGQHCPRHADTSRYKKVASQPFSVVGIANGTLSHFSLPKEKFLLCFTAASWCVSLIFTSYFTISQLVIKS
jgi:hypothetical protein